MQNINERIAMIRKRKQLKQKEFCEIIGFPASSLSEIENGKRCPPVELVVSITSAFHEINSDWLLTGEGSMYKNEVKENSSSYQVKSIHDLEVLFDRVDMLEQQISELKKQA